MRRSLSGVGLVVRLLKVFPRCGLGTGGSAPPGRTGLSSSGQMETQSLLRPAWYVCWSPRRPEESSDIARCSVSPGSGQDFEDLSAIARTDRAGSRGAPKRIGVQHLESGFGILTLTALPTVAHSDGRTCLTSGKREGGSGPFGANRAGTHCSRAGIGGHLSLWP